jgi:hypothetical protein
MRIRLNWLVFMMAAIALLELTGCSGTASSPTRSPYRGDPDPTSAPNEWTWVSGSNIVNQQGSYGTLGVTGNLPGSRINGATWTDAQGNLRLFGGFGIDSTGAQGYLNDLREYQP